MELRIDEQERKFLKMRVRQELLRLRAAKNPKPSIVEKVAWLTALDDRLEV